MFRDGHVPATSKQLVGTAFVVQDREGSDTDLCGPSHGGEETEILTTSVQLQGCRNFEWS